MNHYVDVILPLPLDGLFTYAVPPQLEERLQVGMRVVVPFGRSKSYVALIARLHGTVALTLRRWMAST